ncbi:MAG: Ni/Fe hydrogenase subunit alpha, partial [Magnetospirillum sp.]
MMHQFELETAKSPEALRRIVIEPVSRVEGHGKVTILLDDDDKVHQVRLHIVEFRGFEKFIEGRPYWEVPVLVQRLCGICPVSHHLAASKAMDMIVGGGRLTPTAEKIRRLMHYGQMLQSHALHFFHLSSPDLLFGFDSD